MFAEAAAAGASSFIEDGTMHPNPYAQKRPCYRVLAGGPGRRVPSPPPHQSAAAPAGDGALPAGAQDAARR
eukprot:724558-Pleurochrysis_carterae.AAC.4